MTLQIQRSEYLIILIIIHKMTNKPKENLFYFQEEEDEEQIPEPSNTGTSFQPNTTLTKQLYKIQDTNKLSINFFERDRNTDANIKDVILTNNIKKKNGKPAKLSIPAMQVTTNQTEIKSSHEQKKTIKQQLTPVFEKKNIQEDQVQKIKIEEQNYRRDNSDSQQECSQQVVQLKNLQKNQQLKISKQDSDEQNMQTYNDREVEDEEKQNKVQEDLLYIKISPSEIVDRNIFLLTPIPKGKVLECTVRRDKTGFNRFFPEYSMYTTDGIKYLMSAKKRSGNTTSNYLVSLDKNDLSSKGSNYLGKVRSNWVGTEFFAYDSGHNPDKPQSKTKPRKTLCQIYYQSNFFGSKGPRVMNVYVPKDNQVQKPSNQSLKQVYEKKGNAIHLINKTPKWNPETRTFVLNFNNRVDKPSVKNFILVDKDIAATQTNYSLLFGRIAEDVFNMDVKYPLSPLQAFQIVLSSFDYKLACQ